MGACQPTMREARNKHGRHANSAGYNLELCPYIFSVIGARTMELLSRALLASFAGVFIVTEIVPIVAKAFDHFDLISRALGGH